ncbi:hypothetical protein [Microseira wollei]|uniref:Uncharacterized protein n=1 Tax=Microseira wollei NIES-4236 TaxID=2530354 RepID=A0AAV3XK83_9CYAN|nr:hypothetical protein [Microseira wollei]GET41998.1 hypothetical protein MiSe_68120 [Microseira wollei NIES-4236]
MAKIEIELDDETLVRAKEMAEKNHCTLQELLKVMLEQLAVPPVLNYPLLGGWEDEAELVDEMIEDIMRKRAVHPREDEAA